MYTIGLEVLNQTPKTNESLGNVIANLNDHFSSLSELVNIKRSLIKYGRTDQLLELVQPTLEELNTTCSIEGISTTLSNIWKWIMDKINKLIKIVKDIFGSLRIEARRIISKLRGLPNPNEHIGIINKVCSEKELSNILTVGDKTMAILKIAFDKINTDITREEVTALDKELYNDIKKQLDEFDEITSFDIGDTHIPSGFAGDVLPSWNSIIAYHNKFVDILDTKMTVINRFLFDFQRKLRTIKINYESMMSETDDDEKIESLSRLSNYITKIVKSYVTDIEFTISYYNRTYKKVVADLLSMLNESHKYHNKLKNTQPDEE